MAIANEPTTQKNIRAVIFDIGNVLFKVNLGIVVESFGKIGIKISINPFEDPEILELTAQYDVNKINSLEFIKGISRLSGISEEEASSEDYCKKFEAAWNTVIHELIPDMIQGVITLRKQGYKVFALSDTNEMHARYLQEVFQKKFPGQNFFDLFDKAYLSHERRYQKSKNLESWLQILQEQNLKPEECLFIDDIAANIEKAQSLNINVLHFTPDKSFADVIKTLDELNSQEPLQVPESEKKLSTRIMR